MKLSYNELWKLSIDKGMNKTQLQTKRKISPSTMVKLGLGGNVQTDMLV